MKRRAIALACLMSLVLAGCGARLTGQERLAGIRALSRGGQAGGTAGPGGVGGPGATTGPGGVGGVGATTGPGGPGAPIASVPPGGNGGATDTGVTGNQITLAVASDISGVQPGLFKSTHQAMSAWAAMTNSQGGLYGRAVKLQLLDTKADTTANRAAVTEACKDAFALVGSMSAFDNGGAEVGESCNIPDVSAITVNGARSLAKNVYAVHPIRPDRFAIGTANWIKEKYGLGVIENAAMLYLNAGVTKSNALQRKKAYETAGFKYRYFQEVQVLEANYSPFVQEMKEQGIRYVNMVSDYQSILRLLRAMDQADWYPQVRDWDSVAYAPNFAKGGPSVEGSLVFTTTGISEEASSNPEMQLYISWLSRVAPGARPDYFGFYAWSAGRLFATVHQSVGPKLTRAAFFNEIRKVHSWNGNGLHVAHDVGGKLQSPCFLYLEIRNATFVRKDPPSGFICDKGGIINT